MIELTPVESSNVAAIGYDADSRELRVQFKGGAIYRYVGVPPEVHTALMGAPSKGSAVRSLLVRSGLYKGERVEDEATDGRAEENAS